MVESNGILEEVKRRVVSAHKSEHQHAVTLYKQNKKKRERQKEIVKELFKEKEISIS